jgi:polysaccharide deacetylase family protein (PEP-CTERM system associated)
MKNILTFDIEDWYHPNLAHPEALQGLDLEDRVVESTSRIINMLDDTNNKATFFIVGDVVEKFPELVAKIYRHGHEVASHGFRHNLVYDYTKSQFETDIHNYVQAFKKAVDADLLGYRAPSWSLNDRTPWAWEVLKSFGFTYDSSMYPYQTFLYGSNESPMTAYDIDTPEGKMQEVPPSAIEVNGKRLPFSGGFFFRVAPFWYIEWCMRRYNKNGFPAVMYLHPWEIDVGQPRVPVGAKDRFILYANLNRTEQKLRKLLERYEFMSMAEYLGLDQSPNTRKESMKEAV